MGAAWKRRKIEWWLKNHGPSTAQEIARGCGFGTDQVYPQLRRMDIKRVGKRGAGRNRSWIYALRNFDG